MREGRGDKFEGENLFAIFSLMPSFRLTGTGGGNPKGISKAA
jgi:hypothetical protein